VYISPGAGVMLAAVVATPAARVIMTSAHVATGDGPMSAVCATDADRRARRSATASMTAEASARIAVTVRIA
jgi:hypothetical protein